MSRRFRLYRPRRPIDLLGQPRPSALVWVESAGEEEDGLLRVEGEAHLVERIREALGMSYGSRGRPLEESFSPLDLAVALGGRFMKPFEAEEVPESSASEPDQT